MRPESSDRSPSPATHDSRLKADVAPPLRLRFEDTAEFEEWLRASGLTLDEFETLPAYEWYREELEPFVQASRASRNAAKPQAA